MESEITVKGVKRTESRIGLVDLGGVWYSAFKPKPEADEDQQAAWALLSKVDKGHKLKLWYEVNEKGFKNIHGLEILSADSVSPQADKGNGGDKMSKEDWDKKDQRIEWESYIASAAMVLQNFVTPESDPSIIGGRVIELAKMFKEAREK